MSDPAISKEAEGAFRTFGVRRHLRTGQPVDVDAELDAWQDMRDLPIYAYMLDLLLPLARQATRDRLIKESVAALKTEEPYINSTGYVFLAHHLFGQLRNSRVPNAPDDATAVLGALRNGFDTWERRLSADTNIEILRMLTHYDRDHADDYAAKYLEWQKIILELDETQRLPELVSQGRFFLLVWHYFEVFVDYGLQSEPPTDSFGLDKQEVARALQDWRAGGRITPEPIVDSGDDERLSGEFLRLGYALFRPASAHEGNGGVTGRELEDGRRQFDEKARSIIETLYRMIGRLAKIPPPIEQILRRHEVFVLRRMDDLERSPTA